MEIIINEDSDNGQLIFNELNINENFSLYYYSLLVERTQRGVITIILANLIRLSNIINHDFDEIFFPIEVEDEYLSGIRIINTQSELDISYIVIQEKGYAFDILNFNDFKLKDRNINTLSKSNIYSEDFKKYINQLIWAIKQ